MQKICNKDSMIDEKYNNTPIIILFSDYTLTQVARPCSVKATIRGGIVAMKIPATGMKEATNVNRLKNPKPDILKKRKNGKRYDMI